AVDFATPTTQFFNFSVQQMGSAPAVTKVSVTLIDTEGNKSKPMITDFSGGDAGGARLSTAAYKQGVLSAKGKKFAGGSQVEVNGVVVTPTGFTSVSPKKISVSGDE